MWCANLPRFWECQRKVARGKQNLPKTAPSLSNVVSASSVAAFREERTKGPVLLPATEWAGVWLPGLKTHFGNGQSRMVWYDLPGSLTGNQVLVLVSATLGNWDSMRSSDYESSRRLRRTSKNWKRGKKKKGIEHQRQLTTTMT